MRGLGWDLGRAALVVAATFVAAGAADALDGAPWQVPLIAAGSIFIGAGALANRLWAAFLPLVCAVVWAAVAAATYDPGEAGDMGLAGAVLLLFLAATCATGCLLAGVALRRTIQRLAPQRRDFSPQ